MKTRLALVSTAALVALLSGVSASPALGQNLLTNPDFDTSVSGWTPGNSEQVWSPVDADGDPSSGSARGLIAQEPGSFAGITFRQCVRVDAGQTYDIGASAMVPEGQSRTGSARVIAFFYGNADCNPAGVLDTTTLGTVDEPGSWTELEETLRAPAGSGSAALMFSIFKVESGGELVAHFDKAFLCRPGQCQDSGLDAAWFTDPSYPDFRFRVEITAGGTPIETRREEDCQQDTVCVSGALPGRSELFIRILGPRPNGYFWPTLVRFTPSAVRVEIEQLSTGERKLYSLSAVPPGEDELSGTQDRTGFLP